MAGAKSLGVQRRFPLPAPALSDHRALRCAGDATERQDVAPGVSHTDLAACCRVLDALGKNMALVSRAPARAPRLPPPFPCEASACRSVIITAPAPPVSRWPRARA